MNLNVTWTFSTISPKALLCYDSKVPRRSWPFAVPDRSPSLTVHRPWPLTVPDRFWPCLKRSETLRNAQETVRSRSRFKSERINVQLIFQFCKRFGPLVMFIMNFSGRPKFLTVSMNVPLTFSPFQSVSERFKVVVKQKRSKTVMKRWKIRNAGRLGTFDLEQDNAMERIEVENIPAMFASTF